MRYLTTKTICGLTETTFDDGSSYMFFNFLGIKVYWDAGLVLVRFGPWFKLHKRRRKQ